MRRLIWLATVILITLGMSACGGGAGGEQQQPKARSLPDSAQDLPPGELTLFKFVNVAEVYKPSELIDMSGEITPPPADLVGWFEQHPYLQTDKPESVTVGGIKGEQIDVVVGDLPKDYPEGLCAPSDCVQLTVGSGGE